MLSGLEVCKINIVGYSLDNFKTFDSTGYKVLCRLGETCDALNYFPVTSKIVLNVGEQSQLGYNLQNLLPNIAKDLAIPEEANFFNDKREFIKRIKFWEKILDLDPVRVTYTIITCLEAMKWGSSETVRGACLNLLRSPFFN